MIDAEVLFDGGDACGKSLNVDFAMIAFLSQSGQLHPSGRACYVVSQPSAL